MTKKPAFEIRPVWDKDSDWILELVKEYWVDPFIVVQGVIYYPHELTGFIAIDALGKRVGLVTYVIQQDECDIIILNRSISHLFEWHNTREVMLQWLTRSRC